MFFNAYYISQSIFIMFGLVFMIIRKYGHCQCRFKVCHLLYDIFENCSCFIVYVIVESYDFSEFNSKYIDTWSMLMNFCLKMS